MESAGPPLEYIARIRDYYLALGYDTPYRWAVNAEVPFTPLTKNLEHCRLAIVTTAAPVKPEAGDQGPGAPYNGAAKFFSVYEMSCKPAPDVRISHIAYDRDHTTAVDPNSWFPLVQLQRLASEGVIATAGDTFFGLPTNRSHRRTLEVDCSELVCRVLERGVDACVLVPNCPVCHQSVSLAAVQLEAAGVPTVVMGCARDIVEHVGVPRFLFSDFPLGNSAGKPLDEQSQYDTLLLAVNLLVSATSPRTTLQSPQVWSTDGAWKQDYSNASKLSDEELMRRRAEFDRQKMRAGKP